MAMPVGEQTIPTDEHIHGPGQQPGFTLGANAGAETSSDGDPAGEPVSNEQTSTQQQQAGTANPSGPGFERLFPNMGWNIPYAPSPLEGHPECASIAPRAGSNPPTRKERIPYVPGLEEDLGVSTAWGMEGMPAILMYAPERPLLSGFAGSTASDGAPAENLVLCVVEDAFERAWVAPQGYWRSAF
uniref:Protein kinase A catalytic subunit 1 n=1 Tax=Ganoderma boninense TaxID=34458 RepID=A0A5K1K2H5_9APHY|nr:Protein kinase A catalytic subunit 1 [Ganoderma boninense]